MRLAVVDDNPQDREELMSWLKTALAQRRKPAECLEFSDGASFLEAAGQDHFDLVFLDIYMEGMDGVTAARTLRSFDPASWFLPPRPQTTRWTATGCGRSSTWSSPTGWRRWRRCWRKC